MGKIACVCVCVCVVFCVRNGLGVLIYIIVPSIAYFKLSSATLKLCHSASQMLCLLDSMEELFVVTVIKKKCIIIFNENLNSSKGFINTY
jgi:hypothetical protein